MASKKCTVILASVAIAALAISGCGDSEEKESQRELANLYYESCRNGC